MAALVAAAATATPALAAAAEAPSAVQLQRRAVDAAALPAARRDLAGDGAALVVVQFGGPVRDAWREALAATGVRIVSYLATNAYLVHATAAARPALDAFVASAPEVRGAFPLAGPDKVAPGVARSGTAVVQVQTLAGDPGAAARAMVRDAGRATAPSLAALGLITQRLALPAGDVARLAGDAGVVSVEPDRAPRLLDERQAQIVAGLLAGTGPAPADYLAFHDRELMGGDGVLPVLVDVTDDGIDNGTATPSHPDLYVDGDPTGPDRLAYNDNYTADPTAEGCDGHGDLDASIVAGFNDRQGDPDFEDDGGYQYGLGVAPRAQLGGSKIFRCAGGFDLGGRTLRDVAEQQYAKGARIVSNSWGATAGGAYDAMAQAYDAIVRDASPAPGNQELLEIFAAGNSGGEGTATITSPGTAKNVLTVGASESVRATGLDGCGVGDAWADDAGQVAPFSSVGPTADGRRKPDLVAPGTHVAGARSQGPDATGAGVCGGPGRAPLNALYTLSSGTSHATAAVAGVAALVLDRARRVTPNGRPPSPALVKALLLGGALRLGGPDAAWPSSSQGFGLVQAAPSVGLTDAATIDQSVVLRDSGDGAARRYAVASAAAPVRVTLVYTDAPGPTVGAATVNDLDLVVRTDDGRELLGNHLDGGVSVTGGAPDPRNTAETVVLAPGSARSLGVTVRGASIGGDGVPGDGDPTDQDFALVVANVTGPAPVTSAQASSRSPAALHPRRRRAGAARAGRLIHVRATRRCGRSRRVTIRVRAPRGDRVARVRAVVRGRVVASSRGAARARVVRVHPVPRRAFALTVRLDLRSGARLSLTRHVRGCRG